MFKDKGTMQYDCLLLSFFYSIKMITNRMKNYNVKTSKKIFKINIPKLKIFLKKNKKGVFGLNAVQAFFAIILGIALLAYVIVLVMGSLAEGDILTSDSSSQIDTILADDNDPQSLSQVVSTWSSATTPNKTHLEFDGVNDYIEQGTNDPFSYITYNDSFAISVWINLSEISSDGSIFQNSISNSRIGITIDGNVSEFGSYNGSDWVNANGGEIEKNIWTNIIVTKIEDDYKIYHNKILQSGVNSQPRAGGVSEMLIGKDSNNNYFNGSINNFIIINNTNISNYQIDAIFNSNLLGNNLGKIIPVLYFHHITDYEPSINTNTSDFIILMKELNYSGYETITTENLIDSKNDLFFLPEKPIIIQFDDAWNDTLYIAKPIMDNYSYIGEIPVTVNNIGKNGYLSWNNLSYLLANNWGIVSHTVTHAKNNMTNQTYEERQYEFSQSKSMIEGNLSIVVRSFVFPANVFNSTLLLECAQYYNSCSANKTQYWAPEYSYENSNLTYYGFPRIESWLMDEHNIKQALRIYGDLLNYNLNENQGSIAYDTSGNGNNGTIAGATWNTDGITNTLIEDIDYNRTNVLFNILNSEYAYSQINASYDYSVDTQHQSNLDSILGNTSTGVSGFFSSINPVYSILAVLVIILVLVVLVRVVQNPNKNFQL